MVGAIDFLRDWVAICRESKCSRCELRKRNVCTNQLEKMDDAWITNTVRAVQEVKAIKNTEKGIEAHEKCEGSPDTDDCRGKQC